MSLVNYLLQRANEPYSPFARNLIYASILESMPTPEAQVNFAIEQMGEHVEKNRRNSWLLFHPSVERLSFEKLVGPAGAGSASEQHATVGRVAEFLGVKPRNGDNLRFFDTSGRTFFKGQVEAWREVFNSQQTRNFADRYGDVLRTYGYPEV